MKHLRKYIGTLLLAPLTFFVSCNGDSQAYDSAGYFEAIETLVWAQANGELLSFDISEGQTLQMGEKVGQIDSTQIYLSLVQAKAQKGAMISQKPDIESQTGIIKEQIKTAERELQRVKNLLAGNAATQKQVDDAQAQLNVLRRKLYAQQTALQQSTNSISKQTTPIQAQVAQLQNQLTKCRIINPVAGTVLVKFAEQNELVGAGSPLYKIANLEKMIFRTYLSATQLSHVKLNDEVIVKVQKDSKETISYTGRITWISSKSEFTPKTIQTKDERANEVYALKISVENDGFLRIGMYGELFLQ